MTSVEPSFIKELCERSFATFKRDMLASIEDGSFAAATDAAHAVALKEVIEGRHPIAEAIFRSGFVFCLRALDADFHRQGHTG